VESAEAIVTDRSAWQAPEGAGGSPSGPGDRAAAAAWWSDALADPWRDPSAPAAVVVRPPASEPPPPPVAEAPGGRRNGLATVLVVSIVVALLAGALGGTLGFLFATRNGLGGGHALGGGGSQQSPGALAQRPPDSLAGVVQKVQPSVVTVKITTNGGYALGSGFIISTDGYAITNDHVVEGATGAPSVTFSDGTVAAATLVGSDVESDVAVLKISKTGLAPVTFGDSDQVAVGDPVLAFGSPLALANTVTSGIVSALDRAIEASEGGTNRYYAAIQTDAAVNHGNSGGPLVDSAGRVIGINSVIRSGGSGDEDTGNIGIAFAIPINQAKRLAQDIIESGHARRTVIGATLQDSYSSPTGGVQVSSVTPGGPADRAGIKPGEVLVRLNGVPLNEPTDLIALVRKYAPGESVSLGVRRSTGTQNVQVTLAADAK
jgi:putative serine protease PepD